jgi:1-acyl-sn-glycerol-3-phosphate acyltransferase
MSNKCESGIVVRKPSFFLYTLPAYVIRAAARLLWRLRIDNSAIKNLKPPIFAIAPHTSTLDAVTVVCALLPKTYNLVAARDLFTWKRLKPFIGRFGAIPMNQCAADLACIKTMKNATDEGRNVLIFPEGRTSLDGKQMYSISPSIGKLVKLMDCTVVLVKSKGCYLTKPRYIKGFRRGRIEMKASVLFTKEEVAALPPKEIYERIRENFKFNDNIWQQENGVKFKAKELASNLGYILYKCPRCGAEYENEAHGDLLVCKACKNTVKYTQDGHLTPQGDAVSIDRIDLWVDYERDSVAEEISREGFFLSHPVRAYIRDEVKHVYNKVGEGELFITVSEIGYNGTRDGAFCELKLPLDGVRTIVTKNEEGVDLFIEGNTYRFLFSEHKYSMKYGLIVEKLFEKNSLLKNKNI